jgi:hypothetical protein
MHVVVCGGGLFFTPVAVVLQVYCASLVGGQRCRHRPGWLISTLFKRLDVAGPASGVVFGLPPRKHIWLAGAEWRAEQAVLLRGQVVESVIVVVSTVHTNVPFWSSSDQRCGEELTSRVGISVAGLLCLL